MEVHHIPSLQSVTSGLAREAWPYLKGFVCS